jgi:hypothetical protein
MATAHIERRTLRYESLAEQLHDAQQLAAAPHRTTGSWTYAQILEHLAMAADACFDGFGEINVPWWARWFIAPLAKRRFLTRTMPAGIKLPGRAERLMPREDVTVAEALDHLRRALGRFDQEAPSAPHPFLGRLKSKQEYIALNLRHAELHMGFVHPD